MPPLSDKKDNRWEKAPESKEGKKKPGMPASFFASTIFFILGLAFIIPLVDASSNPKDGFAGAGQGWAIYITGLFISIPALILSFVCVIIAFDNTKKILFIVFPLILLIAYLYIDCNITP